MRPLRLSVLRDEFAICRLPPGATLGDVPASGSLVSSTRTHDEFSVVLPAHAARADWRCERGWRALRVAGPLEFGETGVLASIAGPLAAAGVTLFSVSTYDTDYVLVRAADLERAARALAMAGHEVVGYPPAGSTGEGR